MNPWESSLYVLFAETEQAHEHGSWLFENLREAAKELIIGGPWFLIAYAIHQIHHRVWHKPTHWLVKKLTRRKH